MLRRLQCLNVKRPEMPSRHAGISGGDVSLILLKQFISRTCSGNDGFFSTVNVRAVYFSNGSPVKTTVTLRFLQSWSLF